MQELVGKVALVTGASSGIGAAIAEKLVADGMKVVGLARRLEKMEELAKKLQNKAGTLYPIKADLRKHKDILNALKWVKDTLGPIHVLVNNAGLLTQSTILNISTENIKTTFDTNVIALTILCKDVVNDMINNDINGYVININSILGHNVLNFPYVNVYAGTKFAVSALTEVLRKELATKGNKIRITSLSPGYVDTEIIGVSKEDIKRFESFPVLKSEDIANAVAYVLSCPSHVNITELTIQPVGELF